MSDWRQQLANAIIREVAELPDQTSPENWPYALIVTEDDLYKIVLGRLTEACNRAMAACPNCGAVEPEVTE